MQSRRYTVKANDHRRGRTCETHAGRLKATWKQRVDSVHPLPRSLRVLDEISSCRGTQQCLADRSRHYLQLLLRLEVGQCRPDQSNGKLTLALN